MLSLRRLAAVLAPALVAALPSHASASGFGGFSARPATFNSADPTTRAYFKPKIPAGGVFSGQVIVANGQHTPIHLRVYPVDGLTAVTSGAVYGNGGALLYKAGSWLRPADSTLTIPARTQKHENFTVSVPSGTSPGDHLAGVAFEDMNPSRSGGQFSVTEVFRVVVGVEVRVPGPASAAERLAGASLNALPGTHLASVVVDIGDSGRLLCKPQLRVALQGSGAPRVVTRHLDTILPGDMIPYPLPWPAALAPGDYKLAASATGCGPPVSLKRVVHAGALLQAPKGSTAAQAPVVKHVSPLLMLALIALVSLPIGVILAIPLRKYRRRPRSQVAPSYWR